MNALIPLAADQASLLPTDAGLTVLKAVDGFTNEVAAVIPWGVVDDIHATRHATEGWPPDAMTPGLVLAFGEDGNPVLLRWDVTRRQWEGLRWQTVGVHRPLPQCFVRSPETASYVTSWIRIPTSTL